MTWPTSPQIQQGGRKKVVIFEEPGSQPHTEANCHENVASWFSRIFFCWITPLVAHGFKQPVQLESLPDIGVGSEMRPDAISERFMAEWVKEKRRAANLNVRAQSKLLKLLELCEVGKHVCIRTWAIVTHNSRLRSETMHRMQSKPSLAFALYPILSGYLLRAFITRLLAELIPVFIPVLVKMTTTYAHHKRAAAHKHGISEPPNWQGYVLVFGIFAMLLLSSWSLQWFFYEVSKAAIIARTALASAVYRKSLVLTSQARSRQTLGRLTNLISSDLGQIERGITYVIMCITIPVQVLVSVAVLVLMVGPSSIAGWAVVVGFVPMQMWASKYIVRLRKSVATYTDKRMRATREALQGMKVIKFFVWEDSIASTIQGFRSQETKLIAYINLARYGLISLALNSPVLASILTFAILTVLGGRLHAGAVFAVIGIFNSMSVPLSWLPVALTETRNSKVPLERITDVLLEEELDRPAVPQRKLDVAIRISHGRFAWRYQATLASSENPDSSRESRIQHLGGPRKRNAGQDENSLSLYTYRFPAESAGDTDRDGIQPFLLDTINIEIPHGSLAIIVGPVGSGKSSLMNALVGEMKRISGSLDVGGTLSYAAQAPWIMNATIRDNITFGLPYDEEKYLNVIEACALDIDLAELPERDLTEIGERGVTLSGGQKQRVSIARAAYADSDIVLLDDSLSAVDVSVSHTIFKYCIQGYLKGRTRVLVTHCLDYLPMADLVVTINSGRAVEQGSFANLLSLGGITSTMYNSYLSSRMDNDGECNIPRCEGMLRTQSGSSLHTASLIKTAPWATEDQIDSTSASDQHTGGSATSTFDTRSSSSQNNSGPGADPSPESSGEYSGDIMLKVIYSGSAKAGSGAQMPSASAANRLMSDEERVTGQVALQTYIAYLRAGGGWATFAGVVLGLVLMQGCRVGSDFWMRAWVHSTKDTGSLPFTIGIYALLGLTQFVWFALFALFLVITTYKGSQKLHEGALKRVLRSPMSFFDTTPLGRILNRFTRDMDSLDLVLCEFFRQFYQNISRLVGAFVTISILVPIFLAPLAPLVVVSWLLIFVYMRTSVEVQRVAAMSRSPMYAHYSETLQGAATIRAFRSQARFVLKNDRVLDDANRPQWYSLVAQNWVWLRIDYISHILSLIVCIIIIVQPTHWDSAAIGLMLMQATQMSAYMTYAGRGWTELQNNMNSVERIGYYANSLDQEEQQGVDTRREITGSADWRSPIKKAPSSWPEHGVVIIRNLSLRYRPGLPLALKDINLEVFEGERVGVVGRSGAGKSSLISALFRLVEPCGGKIYVDGVDIQCMPLSQLRRGICILPQDPVLFDGTLRSNLDPLGEYSDTDIWSALESSRLKELVSQLPGRLDSDIGEGGDNFSAGQRQLFCLARVLLRRPRILVLDEATASVDHETDCAIQRIIHSLPTTVISIAHRLQTIITYDKVAVIDEGQVVEFGSPLSLLEQHLRPNQYSSDDGPSGESSQQQHTSVFYSMVRELGEAAANRMYLQAQAAAQGRDK